MVIEVFQKIFWSVFVSLGFAILFNTPRRALWVVVFLGAVGFGIKTAMLKSLFPEQVVLASLSGASAVGILGMYFAHRVHTPPIVFTVPAVINMIPGKFGYEFMVGLLKLVSFGKDRTLTFTFFMDVLSSGLKAGFILMALAFGVIFPILVFNAKTVKDRDLHSMLDRRVLRRMKEARSKKNKDKARV